MSTNILARTVSIIQPFQAITREDGTVYKSIIFKVAEKRKYKQNYIDSKTNQQVNGYKSDFWLVKATGEVAEAFNKNCTAVDENGKLKSRYLNIEGRFETYTKDREVTISVPAQAIAQYAGVAYAGADMVVKATVPQTNTILNADVITYLDPNPNRAENGGQQVTVSAPVAGANYAAGAVQGQTPVAPVMVQAPVAQPAPVVVQAQAPVAQAVVNETPF